MEAGEVEKVIDNKVQAIRATMLAINEQILEQQRHILATKDQQVAVYQRMATIYLLASPKQVELQSVKGLLNKLHQEFALLERQLQQLDNQISQWQLQQSDLQQQCNDKEVERDHILSIDQPFTTLVNEMAQAQQAYQQITQLHEDASKEFTSKLADYTTNQRYNYLIKRKFTEPEYKGFWIFRHLDQWLARQVNFTVNYKNQKTLQALLVESNRRYEASKAHYEGLVKVKDHKILAVEQDVGLSAIRKQLIEITHQLTDYREKRERTYQELMDTQQGEGSRFINIAQQLADIMQQLTTDKLMALTLQTASTEDDQLLNELAQLTQQLANQQQQLNLLREDYLVEEKAFGYLDQFVAEFKRQKMGSRNYLYTIAPRELVRQLLLVVEEKLSSQQMIKHLLSVRVRDETAKVSRIVSSSYLSSSGSSRASSSRSSQSSSSRSSGFSTSASSGGGGFRTTDSF